MTNKIQISQNNTTGYLYSAFKGIKDSGNSSSNNFSSILSSMLMGTNTIMGTGSSSGLDPYGTTDLTSLMMLLYLKLFSESLSTAGTTLENDKPDGNPVNAQLTQGSHDGHVALDYGVPVGTNVHSTMSGKVTYAGWNNEGYGNLVIVENGDYKTYYAHLSEIPVKVGQVIKDGDVIGISGNTGNSTGPHLHYEIRKNNVAINPLLTI